LLELKEKSSFSLHKKGKHEFIKLELQAQEFQNLVSGLIGLIPEHYVDPISVARTLERLGKHAAAEKLRIKIPEAKKIRSGDIGEISATDYIEEETPYTVPIRKLCWRDHRNMAMRGDDVIGILFNTEDNTIKFLKTEAKGNKALSTDVLQKARKELDLDGGLPAPHALSFISERLNQLGALELADRIERAQLVEGIQSNQVEHLLFTFTQSDPISLQKTAFEGYTGNITQKSVGIKVNNHQELISSVYQGIIDGLNN
jgi:hypothetical protein